MTRAIILAAGMGTRLRPLTETTHKSLLTINGEPFLEGTISFLLESKVDEIIIVTGYLKEQFEYLTDKYKEVKLIFNSKYDVFNNAYSLYLVRDFLEGSYILEGDLFLKESVFCEQSTAKSNYFVKNLETLKEEWIVTKDSNSKIIDIHVGVVGEKDYISAGMTYLSENDGSTMRNVFEGLDFNTLSPDIYWDNILKDNLCNLEIFAKVIPEHTVFEIDDLEDYQNLKIKFND